MEKFENKNKGITLIALVITIIILLILAGISIATLGGNNGLFSRTKEAKNNTLDAQREENIAIEGYINKIDEVAKGTGTTQNEPIRKVSEVQGTVLSTTENKQVEDEFGNKIMVPAGFKITTDASNVTQGIVIEDMTEGQTQGNQFVWVPVGKVYTDVAKTEANAKTIELNRYTFGSDGTPMKQNDEIIEDYFEELSTSTENTPAKSISDFKNKAQTNKGYYIGRYEAGNNNDVVICKSSANVWSNITQSIAATKAREMYNNTKPFTSDLINSYAWDTAIVFEETFGTNKNYANKNSINTGLLITTGKSGDVQCNIYDMASNAREWTTENSSEPKYPCVLRGGFYGNTNSYTASRYDTSPTSSITNMGFRPLLYL